MKFDITLLTADKFLQLDSNNKYNQNVILENNIVKDELEKLGLKTKIISWSDRNFNFSDTKITVFRTIWDYFDRFIEFKNWLENVKNKTILINSYETIKWNMDKNYLIDLKNKNVNIPKSIFIKQNSKINFPDIFNKLESNEIVIKPTVSGAARNTFRLNKLNYKEKEEIINQLLKNQEFIAQTFIKSITTFGEISIMLINGIYTHSVIKRAKKGDYRVQDDHGGSVEIFEPTQEQINFAINAYQKCSPKPLYARIDIIIDNDNNLAISELELIEPEFWFRLNKNAARLFAESIKKLYFDIK